MEKFKRKATCDPKTDKNCKCKDYLKIGIENNKPTYTNTRICERKI